MVFRVRDQERVLQFTGNLLAHSSSFRDGVNRWVEFDLYRTRAGIYILSRVGYSNFYHQGGCRMLRKNRHLPAQAATLSINSVPCPECAPGLIAVDPSAMIFPERPLYWAQVCNTADSVLEHLCRKDQEGTRYYTNVARNLLRSAAERDMEIRDVYYVQTIA